MSSTPEQINQVQNDTDIIKSVCYNCNKMYTNEYASHIYQEKTFCPPCLEKVIYNFNHFGCLFSISIGNLTN